MYKHKIETVDDIPVRSRHHRMSQQMKTLVEKEIAEMKRENEQIAQLLEEAKKSLIGSEQDLIDAQEELLRK